jgi:hypothetical protein
MIKHLYRSAKTRCFIKGTQVSHNSCEGVWLFDVKNVQLTNDHGHVICADKLKIVAIDQSLAKVSDD